MTGPMVAMLLGLTFLPVLLRIDSVWRGARSLFLFLANGLRAAVEGPRPAPVLPPAYDDRPPPKCKCHVRGGRGDVVPIMVTDTPTGEPEVARNVCTTCWLEVHAAHVPNRVKVRQAREAVEAAAATLAAIEASATYNPGGYIAPRSGPHPAACENPEYPLESAYSQDGRTVRIMAVGPCHNCGRTEQVHAYDANRRGLYTRR